MRARLAVLLGVGLLAACGVAPPSSGPTSMATATASASHVASAGARTAAPTTTAPPTASPPALSPPGGSQAASPPTAAPIGITRVDCLDGQTVRLHVRIEHDAGIVSYQVWSTWGGGGETTRSFPTPYRTLVEETIEFTHAIADPEPARIHQFGLAITLAGGPDRLVTYQVEPGNRCPGH